ncbi:MAG: right-handed parallel beta-helix repeat-containing protein [Spirochaetaceae bacterium]|jgi:hypothetical protein|nr:right-handed parallel beta-helix repeat-containing protein [Spirochaetaceae bacterium]
MNTRRGGILPALLCLVLASCDPFTQDPAAFFDEQTGTITVQAVIPESGVAPGTDGYVCLEAGKTGFSIPIDNPLGYALTVESSFTKTASGGGVEITGLTVAQQDAGTVRVQIPAGSTVGNEGILHIKVKTAAEGRILYEGNMGIAYIDFDTALAGIEPFSLFAESSFNGDTLRYHIGDAPASFTITATAANPDAAVIINGETSYHFSTSSIAPPMGSSTIPVRVEAPHGAAFREYTIEVTRTFLGIGITAEPAKKIYPIQSAPNEGLIDTGLIVIDKTSVSSVPLSQCTISYDLTTPGKKTVVVSHKGSTAAFSVWVAGLSGLALTGPGGYAAPLLFNPSTNTYDLGTVSFTTNPLTVTAVSGLTGAAGAALSMTVNSGAPQPIISGEAVDVSLKPYDNTITISAGAADDGAGGGGISRSYSIAVRKNPSENSEFFVSSAGSDTTGDGSGEYPYRTVEKALGMIKTIGLSSTDTFTITIAGTITGASGTLNGIVDISGSGYPQIILRGRGAGADAGVLDASGTGKRVLYITGGNKVSLGDNLTLTGGSAANGGGVYLSGDGAVFTMAGGRISHNTATSSGGGVYVTGKGRFTLSGGGAVEENEAATNGGGVYLSGNGTVFEMTGGRVNNNTVSSSGGGVYINSGGKFTLSGGAVEENEAATNGGGVNISGSGTVFTMTGGSVDTNEGSSGGGVYVTSAGSVFEMTGGTISNNMARNAGYGGGGVFVSSGTFTMGGSAAIQNNTSSGHGGGVHSTLTFTMEGGSIRENTAAKNGGGVYVGGSSGRLTKTGGVIYGSGDPSGLENTAGGTGHAVNISSGKKRNSTAGAGVNLDSTTDANWD